MQRLRNARLHRRGMQLSIETLVVIILGTVLLLGGFFIIQEISGVAQTTLKVVDQGTQRHINQLLENGDSIAVAESTKIGRYGSYSFAFGIRNNLPQAHTFKPLVEPVQVIRKDGTILLPNDAVFEDGMPEAFISSYQNGIALEYQEAYTNIPFAITVKKGLPQGTYEYQIKVLYDGQDDALLDDQYDQTRIVRVTIT